MVRERVYRAQPTFGNIAAHSADARKRCRKPRPCKLFKQSVQFFALRVAIHKNRPRTGVHAVRCDSYQVARYARELAAYYPESLAARGDVYAGELFGAQAVGDIVAERRKVVEPVGERHKLVVRHIFREFFLPAVQLPYYRVAARHEIPVELEF